MSDIEQLPAETVAEPTVVVPTEPTPEDIIRQFAPEWEETIEESPEELPTVTKTEPSPAPVQEEEQIDVKDEKRQLRDIQKKFRRLNKEKAEVEAKQAELNKILQGLETDPVAFLREKGITISEWAKKQVETPETKALTEVEKLRRELAEKESKEAQAKLIQEEEQYFKQLTGAIEQEFNKFTESYSYLNVLITDGLIPKENFFPYIAAELQSEYDTHGRKPDIEAIFGRYEEQFRKMGEAFAKIAKISTKTGGVRPVPKANINTLSRNNNQATSLPKEPQSKEEWEASVKQQFGIY